MSIFFDKLNIENYNPKIIGVAAISIPDQSNGLDSFPGGRRNDFLADNFSALFYRNLNPIIAKTSQNPLPLL